MITLTRLSGSRFVLNSDLIERIDSTPDTVISLVDGKKYVVAEGPDAIVEAIRVHRGEVVATSTRLSRLTEAEEASYDDLPPGAHLAPVADLHPRDPRDPVLQEH